MSAEKTKLLAELRDAEDEARDVEDAISAKHVEIAGLMKSLHRTLNELGEALAARKRTS